MEYFPVLISEVIYEPSTGLSSHEFMPMLDVHNRRHGDGFYITLRLHYKAARAAGVSWDCAT